MQSSELDIDAADFAAALGRAEPDIVIHTCGPFQGQDHRVANACLEAGSHYLDLADDRRFVCDIRPLDAAARARDVLLVSGASTVPGLSSVVVDALRTKLERLDAIDIAIAPGNRAERGEATVRAILSYAGHPFSSWSGGRWNEVHGWMNSRRADFGDTVGRRLLANVDVPDLELFPERYAPVETVRFQAGLELPILHDALLAMAWLARIRLVRDWSRYTRPIVSISRWFDGFGTDIGGMYVRLKGADTTGAAVRIQWTLIAENGVGPYVPTISTIILARKLIRGELSRRGAVPCLGMYGLDELSDEAEGRGIRQRVETRIG